MRHVKGQLSAEMIILLLVILAIVAVVASNLLSTSKTAGETFSNKSQQMISNVNNICITDEDCDGGKCINGQCTSG